MKERTNEQIQSKEIPKKSNKGNRLLVGLYQYLEISTNLSPAYDRLDLGRLQQLSPEYNGNSITIPWE